MEPTFLCLIFTDGKSTLINHLVKKELQILYNSLDWCQLPAPWTIGSKESRKARLKNDLTFYKFLDFLNLELWLSLKVI